MIQELDCVALATDLPDYGLAVGDVGTIVHVYECGHSYQVEFTTFDGRTVAVAKVSADRIHPLRSMPSHHTPALESSAD